MSRIALLVICIAPGLLRAENPPVALKIGDKAPNFAARDDQNKVFELQEHIGKKVMVVYFYPADMSTVCSRQACGFRDQIEELKKMGVQVVGVSGDSVNNHRLFKRAHQLNYPLIADEQGKVAKAFGVPVRAGGEITRIIQGRPTRLKRNVTAQRWTFVIGLDGKIIDRNTDVNPQSDSKTVLSVVKQLRTTRQ
ncbi:MAG TPA: peroxiredoxin [Planctomycetaceae bacterium]|nr:peroxiredoxin [Planctomycetaceae bacterium]